MKKFKIFNTKFVGFVVHNSKGLSNEVPAHSRILNKKYLRQDETDEIS